MTTTPTLDQLKRAVTISEQIDALEKELAGILGNHSALTVEAAPAAVKADGRKGKRSAATIAKMKASQKKRWAKVKGKKPAAASKAQAPVNKRTMSPAVRKKLALAMKKRWADAKAGKGPTPNASKGK